MTSRPTIGRLRFADQSEHMVVVCPIRVSFMQSEAHVLKCQPVLVIACSLTETVRSVLFSCVAKAPNMNQAQAGSVAME